MHGGVADALPTVADNIDELTAAVAAADDADVLVFSGGSSVGERDLDRSTSCNDAAR